MKYTLTAHTGDATLSLSEYSLDDFIETLKTHSRRPDMIKIEVLFNDEATLTLERKST